jgi:hypothetical protein
VGVDAGPNQVKEEGAGREEEPWLACLPVCGVDDNLLEDEEPNEKMDVMPWRGK